MGRKEELLKDLTTKYSEDYFKDESVKPRVDNHLEKAMHNLEIAEALFNLSDSREIKVLLKVSSALEAYDWVLCVSYYAMFQAAQAAIAKKGYQCKNHEAAILALEYFYVIEEKLNNKDLQVFNDAKNLEKQYVEELRSAREKRVMASYDVSAEFKKSQAEAWKKKAKSFVNRLKKIVMTI